MRSLEPGRVGMESDSRHVQTGRPGARWGHTVSSWLLGSCQGLRLLGTGVSSASCHPHGGERAEAPEGPGGLCSPGPRRKAQGSCGWGAGAQRS